MRFCASIYLGREERCSSHQVGLIYNAHVDSTETLSVQEKLSYEHTKATLLHWFNKLASAGEILWGNSSLHWESC
jgi:hypothetical protein